MSSSGRRTIGLLTAALPTVPKEFVHKSSAGEVLLTGWEHTGADGYRVTARWPQTHGFYAPRSGVHDPLLLVETIRQTFPLLCHGAFEVPLGHHLVWEHFGYALFPDALRVDDLGDSLELDVDCQEATRRGGRLSALSLGFTVRRGGQALAIAQTRFTIQTPAVYQRLRAGRGDAAAMTARAVPLPPPVPEHTVGRPNPLDVLLSSTDRAGYWQLRVDTAHPFLFDHLVDHAPGALLLDAARQAAQAFAGGRPALPAAMECEFSRYVELDEPCWVEAAPLPRDLAQRTRVRVALQQAGTAPSCSVVVTLVPYDA